MAAETPSDWVRKFAPRVESGRPVLEVACGAGRHTRLFATTHPVTAIDRDLSGVADLRDRPGIRLLEADLEDGSPWPLAQRSSDDLFAGIVVTNYLHRPLFPHLLEALAPDGVLIYETFAQGNERYGRPSNPAFLLEPDELLRIVQPRLHVIAFEQGLDLTAKPKVIQRVGARRLHESASHARRLRVGP